MGKYGTLESEGAVGTLDHHQLPLLAFLFLCIACLHSGEGNVWGIGQSPDLPALFHIY
jgi:hypothetical protein